MKKKFWIILGVDLLIAAIIVGVVILVLHNKNNDDKKEVLKDSEIIESFNEYFSSEDAKVIYLTSANDSYSSLQTPILESIIEDYSLDSLIIDIDDIKKEELEEIIDELDVEDTTPNIIIVKEKEVLATKEGFVDGYNLVNFFIENEVLEEGSEYLAEKHLTIVDYDKFNELYNSDKVFIVTLGQATCSHCIAVKPQLSYIAEKYNITINYLDLTELNETEYSSLSNMVSDIGYTDSIGTPLTLIIKDKQMVDVVEGEVPISKFVKAFKGAGIISE